MPKKVKAMFTNDKNAAKKNPQYWPSTGKKEETETKEWFEELLKGKFHLLKNVQFETRIPGISSITLFAPVPKQRGTSIYVSYLVQQKGKTVEKSQTLRLSESGRLEPLNKELQKITNEDALLLEVLAKVDDLKLTEAFWAVCDQDILPSGEPFEPTGAGRLVKKPLKPLTQDEIDRIKYMLAQPGLAFPFVTKKEGFSGYHGFVFKDGFVVLEHPNYGNAAYIIDETPKIDHALTKEEAEAYVKLPWANVLSKSRVELREEGTTVIIHKGSWEDRMDQEINKRTPTPIKREPRRPLK
jgi:hypothetical protein